MMDLGLLAFFLFIPSVTFLTCRPKGWPLWFALSLLPPFTILLLFILRVMAMLHGLII